MGLGILEDRELEHVPGMYVEVVDGGQGSEYCGASC